MSVLPGYDDLQPKDVIGTDAYGRLLVKHEKTVETYRLQVDPTGALKALPVEVDTGVDQEGEPERMPVSERWASTDQGKTGEIS